MQTIRTFSSCYSAIGLSCLWLVAVNLCAGPLNAADRVRARVIWQDADQQTVYWGDLKQGAGWALEPETIAAFPQLDSARQSHVQMQLIDGIVLTGVHDDEEGAFQSGWVALDSGVTREEHGDHYHLRFSNPPSVLAQRLDNLQGNPAHVYRYGNAFYLANDKKNGFTRVSASALTAARGSEADAFFSAGGGHITLAAIDDNVAYATWIDREGDNMGRVDVVSLRSGHQGGYAFYLPSGGIHGATANAGKVFFAPSDGICWTAADDKLALTATSVDVHHLPLGTDASGKPKRTGAFHNVGNYVVFTTGRGEETELCLVNAALAKPSVTKLPLGGKAGTSFTTPIGLFSRTGEAFAVCFEESMDGAATEYLHVIALDPNRDGDYSDAKLRAQIPVGRSRIEGHSGHHEATPVGKRYVLVSNPGDGTLTLIDTDAWQIQATLSVGGSPTRLVAIAE